ncbi:hypothetical protein GYMLUDRAFT_261160 [Collybiopsis luxurians FD-317 M1]|uniref:Unplaced genomic scaffold GYMLUscaffold_24, whole genome shotgun sequence n=1 Tax=Collybiopsis luxurians FD-317 M1 TaxID=944289 RepID=A0A0D0BC35_9AGAR|nr:hypothetical protein GYMLUDRAFT_261160 [Collybiopsis luxurians FD-317 M1]
MKFSFPATGIVLAAAAARVSAGTFISPAAGSTISSSEPFNFTWVSGRYFKESSNSVTVLLSANWDSSQEGIILTQDLASTAPGIGESGPTYFAELTPGFVASSSHTGEFQLVVVENFNAFGGSPALSVQYQTITLS